MNKPIINRLPRSRVEIKCTVGVADAKPYLDQAVIDISTSRPIKGFRPGKATYEDVSRAYGEMAIWEAAVERIVRATYVKAILDEQLETIGSPSIALDKLVPNEEIAFTVTADLMPTATRLADYSKPIVDEKKKTVSAADIDVAIQDLRKMRRTEAASDKALTMDDLAIVDLEIKKDNVPLEGGVSHDFRVYLNESTTIPGFSEKLVGAKKGDVLDFELTFPKDHYNKTLAGELVTFHTTIKEVYELKLPELNDEFAKGLGIGSMDKLRELITANLQQETDHKADEAAEIELLEKLVKESRFSEIPEILINEEVRRMIAELSQGIESQGGNFDDYLGSLKKTPDQFRMDFIPRAIERIQTAIFLKEVSKQEALTVPDTEIDAEVDRILGSLRPDDAETRERVSSPEYREYIAAQMKNRAVVKLLKEKGVRK